MKRCAMLLSLALAVTFEAPCDARSVVQSAVVRLGDEYFARAPATAWRRAVAVLPIEVPADLERGGAGEAIAAYVREKLSIGAAFVLVERANMEAILAEIELGLSGLADPAKAAKAGALLGAELLVQGSLSEAGGGLVLSLEMVDVATGAVMASVTRDMDRQDIVRGTDDFMRSSFQSQYGISTYGAVGSGIMTDSVFVPHFGGDEVTVTYGSPLFALVDAGVSYKPLPWLGLCIGVVSVNVGQFYLTESGKVVSPLSETTSDPDGEESIRYMSYSGSGPSLGLVATLSPTPRINLSASTKGFVFVAGSLKYTLMDYASYDIVPNTGTDADSDGVDDGMVDIVKRDITIEGTAFGPLAYGLTGSARGEFLLSRRMSLGLEAGYLWSPPFVPDRYTVGAISHTSNTADAFETYQDKNGTFDFLGGFNVARKDGTTDSEFVTFDPSCLYATLFVAVHF